MNPFITEIHGETFHLYAERAAHWPRMRTIFVSDIHLGKAETFQQNGLWLPPQAQRDDLARLSDLVLRLKPARVLILGDLVHTKKGVTREVEDLFASWLHAHDVHVQVLIGNHDRHLAKTWPDVWSRTEVLNEVDYEGFRFRHEPDATTATHHSPASVTASLGQPDLEIKDVDCPPVFAWLGHLHPTIRLQSASDRLRLPCFYVRENEGYLPAFSSLAGGENVHPGKGERAIATSLDDLWVGEVR